MNRQAFLAGLGEFVKMAGPTGVIVPDPNEVIDDIADWYRQNIPPIKSTPVSPVSIPNTDTMVGPAPTPKKTVPSQTISRRPANVNTRQRYETTGFKGNVFTPKGQEPQTPYVPPIAGKRYTPRKGVTMSTSTNASRRGQPTQQSNPANKYFNQWKNEFKELGIDPRLLNQPSIRKMIANLKNDQSSKALLDSFAKQLPRKNFQVPREMATSRKGVDGKRVYNQYAQDVLADPNYLTSSKYTGKPNA